jgi:hypothetical protein
MSDALHLRRWLRANAYFAATGKLVTTLPFSTTLAM